MRKVRECAWRGQSAWGRIGSVWCKIHCVIDIEIGSQSVIDRERGERMSIRIYVV